MWLSLYILGMYSTIPIVNIINHCAKSSEANTANLIRMQREREIEREEKKVRKRDTGKVETRRKREREREWRERGKKKGIGKVETRSESEFSSCCFKLAPSLLSASRVSQKLV